MTDFLHDIHVTAIVGPTASGKSGVALALAQRWDAEIINADSLQVYRLFNIGTGKLSPEQRQGIPHHLMDIRWPDEPYDAGQFRKDADHAIADITARGKRVILAGGTGLYLRALLHGLFDIPSDPVIRQRLQNELEQEGLPALYERLRQVDPEALKKIGPNDAIRIIRALEVYEVSGKPFTVLASEHQHQDHRYPVTMLGINPDRTQLYTRIDQRIDKMLREGWVTEIHMLRKMGYSPDLKPMKSIGYNELNQMLDGILEPDEAIRLIRKHTRTYARRQMTWFRKENVRWYDSPDALLKAERTPPM